MKRYIVLLLFGFYSSVAQTVTTSVDKKTIKIGDQVTLTLQLNAKKIDQVIFPELDSLGKWEVVTNHPVKTIRQKNIDQLVKKYTITQFNSGTYTIPSVEIVYNKQKINTQKQTIEAVCSN